MWMYRYSQSVIENGANAYCTKMAAARASRLSPASSAITITLFAVGVQVTIIATSRAAGWRTRPDERRAMPVAAPNAGITTILAAVRVPSARHETSVAAIPCARRFPRIIMLSGTAALPTPSTAAKSHSRGASHSASPGHSASSHARGEYAPPPAVRATHMPASAPSTGGGSTRCSAVDSVWRGEGASKGGCAAEAAAAAAQAAAARSASSPTSLLLQQRRGPMLKRRDLSRAASAGLVCSEAIGGSGCERRCAERRSSPPRERLARERDRCSRSIGRGGGGAPSSGCSPAAASARESARPVRRGSSTSPPGAPPRRCRRLPPTLHCSTG
mmetsp:Transcript_32936/g.105636  ORF Transcript_32936/g.105636 Transcript_32936/m.105636 type:complete len:330 (-) Transcript_32936:500-1489(-)